MGANETRITRITRAIDTVTSIFRCHGLQSVPPNADRLGGHDLLYWVGFLGLLSGWFLFVYMPQCRRFERLTGRQQALVLELETEKKDLARLHQGIASLHKGDALAWERAARNRLGWLEPGEVLDAEKWLQSRNAFAGGQSLIGNRGAQRLAPSMPVLPRPRVPQIPRPQQSVPSGFTRTHAPPENALPFANSGALGPTAAQPPLPPAIPLLPPRSGFATVQRASTAQPVNFQRRN